MDESTPLLGSEGAWQKKKYLYGAHALQAFGDRTWAFAVPMLFMNIFPDSLLPSALFSMILYLGNFLLMAPIGSWVDRTDRLTVMRMAVYGQGLAILANIAFLWLLLPLVPDSGDLVFDTKISLCFSAIMVTAILAELMGNAASISIERDWTVVLADGDSKLLTGFNATLRQIDLGCALLAPTAFGLLLTGCASVLSGGHGTTLGVNHDLVRVGSGAVAAWNVLAMLPEYIMAKRLYEVNAKLQTKQMKTKAKHGTDLNPCAHFMFHLRQQCSGWCAYLSHPVSPASIFYCLLYLTILDGGTLMTAYLKWLGVSEAVLGGTRGFGALFGLLGTAVFPSIYRCLGSLRKTGVVFLWLFFLCMCPAAYCFLIEGVPPMTKAYLVLGVVAGSRIFLWGFDLAHTQVMQESVAEYQRGDVNAGQTALYQVFWVVVGALGVLYNDPNQFHVLVLVSVACVGSAAVGWTLWAVFSPSVPIAKVQNDTP